jgi:hypothetical protein
MCVAATEQDGGGAAVSKLNQFLALTGTADTGKQKKTANIILFLAGLFPRYFSSKEALK